MTDYQENKFINSTPGFLFFLLLFVFLGALLGSLLVKFIGGNDMQQWLFDQNFQATLRERNTLRSVQLVSHLFTFTLPALAFGIFFYKKSWLQAFQLNKLPSPVLILAGGIFLLCSFPPAQWLLWWNSQLPLPEWAFGMEESTARLLKQLLNMEQPSELLFNLLLIGVAPALGEELLFRGILQQYLQKISRRPHLAIWITATIFSLFHFQLAGFFARMLLGACLGYLLFWTNNLWVPIIAHLVINGMQVLLPWINPEMLELAGEAKLEGPPSLAAVLASTALMALTGWWISRQAVKNETINFKEDL